MRLKRLELFGFKSFLDKTTIHFKPGITAIVGPNGCGKSNLIDAVLWVLGEQRPKALRGDKMEDVIFNGTEERKPLGMAEVALTVDDLRDPLPSLYSHYSEITFMRRLYRSGESEYFINQVPCRLKDIRDLLMDLKAGYRAIIEQGRIDDLLTASPLKRRELVEEAAGISKYRIRKEEATRKLQTTQQNLLRLQDVLSEVKRQINALDRQAKAAQKYKNLYEALKAHDLYLSAAEWQMGQALEKTLSQEEALLRERLTKQETYAASLDLKGSTLQLTLSQKEADLTANKDQMANITGQIGKAEGRIERIHAQKKEWHEMQEKIRTELAAMETEQAVRTEALRVIEDESTRVNQERADMEERFAHARNHAAEQALALTQTTNRLERERTEIFDIASRLAAAHNTLLHYNTRQAMLTPKMESDRARIHEQAQKSNAVKEHLAQLQNEGKTVEQQWAGESARHQQILRALADIEAKQKKDEEAYYKLKAAEAHQSATLSAKEGFYREQWGPLPLVEPARLSGAASLMADLLDVPEPYEKAIEAVLGERLQGHLIEDLTQLQASIQKLQTLKKGRGLLILRDLPHAEKHEPPPLPDLPEGVMGYALSWVSCQAGHEAVVQRLLGNVVIVRDTDTACSLLAQRFPWDMVTLRGELFYKGVVSVGEGGEGKEDRGLLNQKRALAALAKDVKQLQGQAEQQALEIEKNKKEHQAIRIQLEQIVRVIGETEARRRTLQTAIHNQIVENEKIALTYQTLLQEQEDDRHEQETLTQRAQEEHATIATLKQIQEDRERQWAKGLEEQKDLERRHQEGKEQSVALQLTLTTLQEKGRHLIEKKEHADKALKALAAHHENQAALLAAMGNKWTHAEYEEKEAEGEIEAARLNRERLQEEIRNAMEAHTALLAAFESFRAETRSAQSEKEQRITDLHEKSVRRLEAKMNQEKLQETILTQYQIDLAHTPSTTFPLPAVSDVTAPKSNAMTLESAEATPVADQTSREALSLLDIPSETFIRLRAKRDQLRASLTGVEPVHPGVIEEYQELVERHTFLKSQESDLTASMEDLKTAISKMNQMTQGLFRATFNQLNKNFAETFAFFFEGGKAELTLDEPDHLTESGVSILAAPPGKKPKTLNLLSGGEKALTGLSLLFSMFAVQTSVPSPEDAEATTASDESALSVMTRAPFEEIRNVAWNGPSYPFCILDEVDAALDEENAHRFSDALTRLSENSQFVVITHNKQTMQKADMLYGVTAEQAGLSRLVSVNLREMEKSSAPA